MVHCCKNLCAFLVLWVHINRSIVRFLLLYFAYWNCLQKSAARKGFHLAAYPPSCRKVARHPRPLWKGLFSIQPSWRVLLERNYCCIRKWPTNLRALAAVIDPFCFHRRRLLTERFAFSNLYARKASFFVLKFSFHCSNSLDQILRRFCWKQFEKGNQLF